MTAKRRSAQPKVEEPIVDQAQSMENEAEATAKTNDTSKPIPGLRNPKDKKSRRKTYSNPVSKIRKAKKEDRPTENGSVNSDYKVILSHEATRQTTVNGQTFESKVLVKGSEDLVHYVLTDFSRKIKGGDDFAVQHPKRNRVLTAERFTEIFRYHYANIKVKHKGRIYARITLDTSGLNPFAMYLLHRNADEEFVKDELSSFINHLSPKQVRDVMPEILKELKFPKIYGSNQRLTAYNHIPTDEVVDYGFNKEYIDCLPENI